MKKAPSVKFFFSDTYHRANLDVNETATICTLLFKALFALFHRSSLAGAGKKLQTEKTYQRLKILDFRCPTNQIFSRKLNRAGRIASRSSYIETPRFLIQCDCCSSATTRSTVMRLKKAKAHGVDSV